MKRRIITGTLCTIVCINVHAQTIQSGTTLTLQPGTSITTNQDLIVEENATLENEGTVFTSADFTNRGNNYISGRLVFNGNEDQFIDGKDSFSIETLSLNTRRSVSLNSAVTITDKLDMQRGLLYTTAGHPVMFGHAAQNPIETDDSYIYGTAISPLATPGSAAWSFLGADISEGADPGEIKITRVTGDDAIIQIGDNQSIAVKWDINTSVPKAAGHDITFNWLPAFDNSLTPFDLELYANTDLDNEKFMRISNGDRFGKSPSVDYTTRMRSCTREELDYINRTFTMSTATALTSVVEENKITAFPNPVTTQINLLLENFDTWATTVEIRITDVYGKEISSKLYPLNGNLITVNDLGVLAPGIYRLNVIHGQVVQVINFLKN